MEFYVYWNISWNIGLYLGKYLIHVECWIFFGTTKKSIQLVVPKTRRYDVTTKTDSKRQVEVGKKRVT